MTLRECYLATSRTVSRRAAAPSGQLMRSTCLNSGEPRRNYCNALTVVFAQINGHQPWVRSLCRAPWTRGWRSHYGDTSVATCLLFPHRFVRPQWGVNLVRCGLENPFVADAPPLVASWP